MEPGIVEYKWHTFYNYPRKKCCYVLSLQRYFGRMTEDLEVFASHAKRKTIEKEDVELLMRRSVSAMSQHPPCFLKMCTVMHSLYLWIRVPLRVPMHFHFSQSRLGWEVDAVMQIGKGSWEWQEASVRWREIRKSVGVRGEPEFFWVLEQLKFLDSRFDS